MQSTQADKLADRPCVAQLERRQRSVLLHLNRTSMAVTFMLT